MITSDQVLLKARS